jgi:erythromycin esterase
MRRAVFLIVLCFLRLPAAWAAPNPFLDLDFEAPECTSGWFPWEPSLYPYDNVIDGTVAHSGAQSLRSHYTGPDPWDPYTTGGIRQVFPVADAAGKRVRLGGWIRSEAISEGYAGLFVLVFRTDGRLTWVDMSANGVTGTTPWTRYEVEMDVPANARTVHFGSELYGNGTARFDNFEITVDGQRWHEGPADPLLQPSPGHTNWLREAAIPVTTTVAGNGFADLQPLKNVIGDARIVSLGEATHGTREFFEMKHRMVEFLATEMGFTYFAIEANMPEAYKVNEYVLTGQGDPAELLEGMYFWTWNTQEVLDMILWMREFNASGRGLIQFTGFDMQFSAVAAENVRTFLAQVEPEYVPTANAAFAPILAAELRGFASTAAAAAVRSVFEHLSGRRNVYLQTLPAEQVDWAIQNARIVLQDAELLAGITPRDQSMAANVEWILDHAPAGSKIVLWAHNVHVSKEPSLMGEYLAQRYGDEMYVLGFAFGEGSYNARGAYFQPETGEALPPPLGSLESFLRTADIPRYILDLRHLAPEEAPWIWFGKPRHLRWNLGAVVNRCPYRAVVAADKFDGLIWIDQTNPSQLLPFD